MKVLVHTGHLAEKLAEIDFESQHVSHCKIEHDTLYLYTHSNEVEIYCASEGEKDWIWQNDRRWDWVMELANSFPDCPVVLDISQKQIKVIFDF